VGTLQRGRDSRGRRRVIWATRCVLTPRLSTHATLHGNVVAPPEVAARPGVFISTRASKMRSAMLTAHLCPRCYELGSLVYPVVRRMKIEGAAPPRGKASEQCHGKCPDRLHIIWPGVRHTPMRAELDSSELSQSSEADGSLKHSDGLKVPMWARGALTPHTPRDVPACSTQTG
jgi:hypothetical protein